MRCDKTTSPVPKTRQRLERFDRELAELGHSHLAAVDNHLTRAAKMAELPNPTQDGATREEQSKALKGARHEQEIVLESLRSMLGNLAQWRDWQEVHEALRELVEGQEKLNGETGDLSRATLAKPLSELGKQEQADLARLAERQTQLGEQVDRIGQRLREAAEALKSSNREAAQEAASTLKSLEKTDPQARMREIGGQLAQNNIGQAMARQHQLLDELRKLDRTFSQRPETDLKSLVGRLGDAGQRIESLRKDQEELRKRTEQLAKKKDAKSNDPQLADAAKRAEPAAGGRRRDGPRTPPSGSRNAQRKHVAGRLAHVTGSGGSRTGAFFLGRRPAERRRQGARPCEGRARTIAAAGFSETGSTGARPRGRPVGRPGRPAESGS